MRLIQILTLLVVVTISTIHNVKDDILPNPHNRYFGDGNLVKLFFFSFGLI
jgi:hypothetical protein